MIVTGNSFPSLGAAVYFVLLYCLCAYCFRCWRSHKDGKKASHKETSLETRLHVGSQLARSHSHSLPISYCPECMFVTAAGVPTIFI